MPLDTLSPREREIVARLARGEPQKAIASDLAISTSAVRVYVSRAKFKLGAKTVIHLAVLFTKAGTYRPGDGAA